MKRDMSVTNESSIERSALSATSDWQWMYSTESASRTLLVLIGDVPNFFAY